MLLLLGKFEIPPAQEAFSHFELPGEGADMERSQIRLLQNRMEEEEESKSATTTVY
ncbi:Hypothetical protein FKW44_020603 [Caligus rogercresseyi]|uniref:Uncharacterized protein n=1 Tax=Caligus rogercresseyi TaxID=217165 RepID=A0A7T8JYB6_CALRO|nr:Hypothetical protein FKW44_020603 [Caligus rogercresseyi]